MPVLHDWQEGQIHLHLANRLYGGDADVLPPCDGGCRPEALTDAPFYLGRKRLEASYPCTDGEPCARLICTTSSVEAWIDAMVKMATAGDSRLPRHYHLPYGKSGQGWSNSSQDRATLALVFARHFKEECTGLPLIDLQSSPRERWHAFCSAVPVTYRSTCAARSAQIGWPNTKTLHVPGDSTPYSKFDGHCVGRCAARGHKPPLVAGET